MNDVPTAECGSEYNRNNSAKVVLVRVVVMAMARRRYDRAACGADISLVRQQAGVNFRMIGDVRAAKAEGIILTGDCLLLEGFLDWDKAAVVMKIETRAITSARFTNSCSRPVSDGKPAAEVTRPSQSFPASEIISLLNDVDKFDPIAG